jgi:peptide/nickel transport system substrate-binding protein
VPSPSAARRTAEQAPPSFGLYIRQIAETTVVDATTIRFRTSSVFPLMPAYLSTFGIVSASMARRDDGGLQHRPRDGRHGPYRFVSWAQGDRIVLERNPSHGRRAEPWGQVSIRFMRSPRRASRRCWRATWT